MTKLRFIGKDKSMGLTKGSIYDVVLEPGKLWPLEAYIRNPDRITVFCPYSSSDTFFENWETVNAEQG